MKHIKIDIKTVDCDSVFAWATVYDCNYNEVSREEIDYPNGMGKLEIAEPLVNDEDFTIKFDWIGGRPNDRA